MYSSDFADCVTGKSAKLYLAAVDVRNKPLDVIPELALPSLTVKTELTRIQRALSNGVRFQLEVKYN
jgi:hypothetical protein